MTKRRVFSNINSFLLTATEHPAILDISSLATLKPALEASKQKSGGCACNRNKNLQQYKAAFDAAMSAMSDSEKATLKQQLGVTEICYYKDNNGVMDLKCF